MRDCLSIEARRREGKKVPPSVLGDDAPSKNHFYAHRARGSKPNHDAKFFFFSHFVVMSSFYVGEYGKS